MDKGNRCFRCGEIGHLVRTCTKRPKCAVCEEEGRDREHRIGSARCLIERYPARNWNSGGLRMNREGGNREIEKDREAEGTAERRSREVYDTQYTPDRNYRAMEIQDES